MTKLVWISDLHFTAQGDVLGHDPRARLDAAVAHINTHHSDAACCVISGDLANHGTDHDYTALQQHLSACRVPVWPMVGNHDDRALVADLLPLPAAPLAGFVQYSVDTEAGRIICLDTQKAGADAGAFCEARRAWLRGMLEDAGEVPVYLFMHHPPLPLGLPMQDTDCMEEGQGFLDLLSDYACVKYMFIGHVHRPISGVMGGIPFSTMRSVLYQAPPPVPAWDWAGFAPGRENPQLGVVSLSAQDVTVQYEEFCTFEVGT